MATTIQTIEIPKKARAVDTSGNNNHGQIYSGRGLEFDGVGDYLTIPQTTISTGAWTVAAWINTSNVLNGTMDHVMSGGSGNRAANYIGVRNGMQVSIYDHTAGAFRNANTVLSDNTWYRVLWVYDGAGEITFYVNGVADGTGVITTSGVNDDLVVQYIGSLNGTSRWWNGMLSDFQAWDAAFTQADVTYDYLNPESLALNNSGTALTESNLKLWYPMQDGHRGQQSYILDGANTGLGVEKVTNGDFATDSDWTKGTGWTISGNAANFTYSTPSSLIQDLNVTSGLRYLIEYEIVSNSGVSLKGGGNSFFNVGSSIPSTVGLHSFYVTAVNSSGIDFRYLSGSGSLSVTNISVKAINDKHHATTVFHGDEQISATNDRTFAGASNWANAAGANAFNAYDETTSGQLTVTPDDVGDVQYAFLDGAHWEDADGAGPAMVEGRTYRLSYDIHVSAFTKGTLSVGLSTDAVPAVMTFKNDYTATNGSGASATLDFVYTAATCEMITVYAAANTVLTADFDNFSLKEVGTATGWTDADQQLHIPQTALQSYNELAWFDGTTASNGYVDLDTQIATTNNDWSLSFWMFRLDTGAAYSFIFGQNDNEKIIAVDNNGSEKLSYRATGGAYHALSNAALPYGEWVSIVITAKADTSMTAYINGVAQTTNSDMSDTELVLDWIMRGYQNANYNILGTINEISYYNDILTAAEALDLFNDGKAKSALEASGSAGLVGYWRNNGLSEWKDLKGSNDGNTTDGVVETILIPQGADSTRDNQGFIMTKQKSTSSLNLTNGIDDPHVDLGSVTVIANDASASIIMWLKPDDLVDNYFIGAEGNDTIRIRNASKFRLYFNGTGATDYTVSSMTAKEWMHVAITRNGSDDKVRVYVNGIQNGGATAENTVYNQPFDYRYLGAINTSTSFRGSVDGVLIYSDQLSDAEVLRNYNATKGNHRN